MSMSTQWTVMVTAYCTKLVGKHLCVHSCAGKVGIRVQNND